jgi:hypothetical protein
MTLAQSFCYLSQPKAVLWLIFCPAGGQVSPSGSWARQSHNFEIDPAAQSAMGTLWEGAE